MKILIHIISSSFITGFITGWSGLFIGIISAAFVKDKGKRFKGSILGLLSGIMIGVVSFDLLPETFEEGPIYVAVSGIAIGLFLAVLLDGKLEGRDNSFLENRNHYFKAAIFMAIGFGIHNLPSGFAVGSLAAASPESGFNLIIALILHDIPEGLTLGILLNECKTSKLKQLFLIAMISLPMGLGSILGGIIHSPSIICISLGFASAMILYITLRETLPAANETWKGRITTIGNVVGMIIGMLMVSFLH